MGTAIVIFIFIRREIIDYSSRTYPWGVFFHMLWGLDIMVGIRKTWTVLLNDEFFIQICVITIIV